MWKTKRSTTSLVTTPPQSQLVLNHNSSQSQAHWSRLQKLLKPRRCGENRGHSELHGPVSAVLWRARDSVTVILATAATTEGGLWAA